VNTADSCTNALDYYIVPTDPRASFYVLNIIADSTNALIFHPLH
jgi:hypothetical protein